MSAWLIDLKTRFNDAELALKILLEPHQQSIGDRVYEVTFIADTDGLPLEFIRRIDRP